jgi:transposase
MPVAGLDVHKRVVEAVLLDEQGAIAHRERFACTREELERFARQRLTKQHRVALEATTNTWAVVDVLKPFVEEVVVSNPMRTRMIAEAKVKTDRVDAEVLAQLLRCDYLPRVWAPDEATQRMRRLCSRRASLVGDRTRVKNRVHAVLHQRLIPVPEGDLFGKGGRAWLCDLALDVPGRDAIDSELRLLDAVEVEMSAMAATLAEHGYQDDRVKLLMTLPGVDVAVAQTLLSTLGDHTRFRSGDHAASYLGLVPSTKQSADHCYHGPITKAGRSHARWMLVQAAQHVGKHPGPLGVFFRRVAKRKNRNVAVVATARKLVVIAWLMLKNKEPYRYALPKTTETKLARMRVAATGERRVGGNARGARRPAGYGSGEGTRAVPSIDQVLAREALPPTAPLSAGEQHTVRRAGVTRFVQQIHQPHRVARATSAATVKTPA